MWAMGIRWATTVPVLPSVRDRIIQTAVRDESGCLISARTPSKRRPWIWIPDRHVSAIRIVAAVTLGRPVSPDEDIHHLCHVGRCVEPSHLVAKLVLQHSSDHAAEQTQSVCTTHNRPYDYRNERGWGRCKECDREGTARYRAANQDKIVEYRQSEAGKESSRRGHRTYLKTEHGRATAARLQRERRARIKASGAESVLPS